MSKHQSTWDKIWRDRKGNVVLWQRPNWLLMSWAVVTLAWMTTLAGKYSQALFGIGVLLLVAWGILESTRGVNYFRRSLGVIVLIGLLALSPQIYTIVFS